MIIIWHEKSLTYWMCCMRCQLNLNALNTNCILKKKIFSCTEQNPDKVECF